MTVSWNTNERATSRVEFGASAAYDRMTEMDSTLVTSHAVVVQGLASGTRYHFRARSRDESGNEAVSSDYSVTTLARLLQAGRSDEYIARAFSWEYDRREWNWQPKVSAELYQYYRDRSRPETEDYSIYVTDPWDDDLIDSLVDSMEEAAGQAHFDKWETVNFAVAFVQSLPYTSDQVTAGFDEYPRYPVETLVDNGGDCEDTSILMAAILDAMGYGVVLLKLPGHMAVGVLGGEGVYGTYWEHNSGKYYYLETTGSGWDIGEIPDEYRESNAQIYDIVPVAILAHNWTATNRGWGIDLRVTVRNVGTGVARDAYVFAGLDAGNGQVWGAQRSGVFSLEAGASYVVTVTLYGPTGVRTRLVVQIVDDGYAADQSYSEWFNT